MPNINDAFPSKYFRASDLQGKSLVVTIERIDFEPVGQTREMKPVVYFIGKTKGVVLNKTNARKITEIAGSGLTEDWKGTAITIFPTETEYAGETVECIRVKAVNKLGMQRMTKPEPAVVQGPAFTPPTDDDIPF